LPKNSKDLKNEIRDLEKAKEITPKIDIWRKYFKKWVKEKNRIALPGSIKFFIREFEELYPISQKPDALEKIKDYYRRFLFPICELSARKTCSSTL